MDLDRACRRVDHALEIQVRIGLVAEIITILVLGKLQILIYTAIEDGIADIDQRVREGDLLKRGSIRKCGITDRSQTLGKHELLQRRASVEGISLNRSDFCGNLDFLERSTFVEEVGRDGRYALGNFNRGERATTVERTRSDRFHFGGKRNVLQCSTSAECVGADRSQRGGQYDSGQCRAISEGFVVDRGNTLGDHNRSDVGAVDKCLIVDLRYLHAVNNSRNDDLGIGAGSEIEYCQRTVAQHGIDQILREFCGTAGIDTGTVFAPDVRDLINRLGAICLTDITVGLHDTVFRTGGGNRVGPNGAGVSGSGDQGDIDHAALGTDAFEATVLGTGNLLDLAPFTEDVNVSGLQILSTGPQIDVINVTVDQSTGLEDDAFTDPCVNIYDTVRICGGLGDLDEVNHVSCLHVDRMTEAGLPLETDGHGNVKECQRLGIIIQTQQLLHDRSTHGTVIGGSGGIQIDGGIGGVVRSPLVVEHGLVVSVTADTEVEGVEALTISAVFGNDVRIAGSTLRAGIHHLILQRVRTGRKLSDMLTVKRLDHVVAVLTVAAVTVVGEIQLAVADLEQRVGIGLRVAVCNSQLLPAEQCEDRIAVGGVTEIIKRLGVDQRTARLAALIALRVIAVAVFTVIIDHINTMIPVRIGCVDVDLFPIGLAALIVDHDPLGCTAQNTTADRLDRLGQIELSQAVAILESQALDRGHTLRDLQAGCGRAAEGIDTDRDNRTVRGDLTVADSKRNRSGKLMDHTVALAVVNGVARRYGQLSDRRTSCNCILTDIDHTGGDLQLSKLRALTECAAIDKLGGLLNGEGFRLSSNIHEDHIRIALVAEILAAILGLVVFQDLTIGNQCTAHLCQGVRQRYCLQSRASVEYVGAQNGNTLRDHSGNDLRLISECAARDLGHLQSLMDRGDHKIDELIAGTGTDTGNLPCTVCLLGVCQTLRESLGLTAVGAKTVSTPNVRNHCDSSSHLFVANGAYSGLSTCCDTGGSRNYSPLADLVLMPYRVYRAAGGAGAGGHTVSLNVVFGNVGLLTPFVNMGVGPQIEVIDITVHRGADLEDDRVTGNSIPQMSTGSLVVRLGNENEISHINGLHVDALTDRAIHLYADGDRFVHKYRIFGSNLGIILEAGQLLHDRGTLMLLGAVVKRGSEQIDVRIVCLIRIPLAVKVALVVTVAAYAEVEGIVASTVIGHLGLECRVT